MDQRAKGSVLDHADHDSVRMVCLCLKFVAVYHDSKVPFLFENCYIKGTVLGWYSIGAARIAAICAAVLFIRAVVRRVIDL